MSMPSPASLDDAPDYRQRLMEYIEDTFSRPFVIELLSELAERQPGSNARVAELRELDVNNPVLWPFHAPQLPPCIERAEGSRIWDVDGNEYLDCHLGMGTQSLHGHNPEPVVRFVREQLGRSVGAGFFHPLELEFCRLLKRLLPHCERFAFLNTGTDATAGAIRLARAFSGKRLVVKFEGSMHGVHDLGVQNTLALFHGHPMAPFARRQAEGLEHLPFTLGVSPSSSAELLVLQHGSPEALEVIERRRDEIACVLAEPTYSAFPFEEKSIPFTRQLAEHCRRLGVLFVLDEVTSGFRCGMSGAAGKYDIPADLITYGKVISGLGLPLSAIGGRADIMEQLQTTGMALADFGQKVWVNSTHMNNHLALAAGFASLSLLEEKGEAYHEQTRQRISRLRARLAELRAAEGIPIHLLGFGEFMGSFMLLRDGPMENARDLARAANGVGATVLALMLRRRGVYTFSLPIFFSGGAHSEQELDTVYEAVAGSLLEMKRHGFPFLAPR
jgi:glutamate-1-semialdehyde 2,1-aminomutase